MAANSRVRSSRLRLVQRTIGAAALLALLPLAACGSKPKPIVTGSTTTCVPMGKSVSCSCTPIAPGGS